MESITLAEWMAGLALGGVSYLWTLARALTALLLVWCAATWLNRQANGFNLHAWMRNASGSGAPGRDSLALGVYLGLRWLGLCVLVAVLLS